MLCAELKKKHNSFEMLYFLKSSIEFLSKVFETLLCNIPAIFCCIPDSMQQKKSNDIHWNLMLNSKHN